MNVFLQIIIGVAASVIAAIPVALITRRINPEKPVTDNSPKAVAGDCSTIVQTNVHGPKTYQSFRTYVTNQVPHNQPRSNGSSDDVWSWIIGMIVVAIAAATILAKYSEYLLASSVGIVTTLVTCALILTLATRRKFGSLPAAAITVLSNISLVVLLTPAVWFLVLTTDRHGVSLDAANAAANSDKAWFPMSAILDTFDLSGVLLIASLFLAIVATFLTAVIAGLDLVFWSGALRAVGTLDKGRTPSELSLRLADRFDRLKPANTVALTLAFGAVAIFLATGLLYEWSYRPDSADNIAAIATAAR